MARDYARIFTRIWNDQEFVALPALSQRAYLMLVSQPSMNYAGVLDVTIGRWARYAPDSPVEVLMRNLDELARRRFVVIDYETEELLVRSYMVVDEIHKQARVTRVAVREALAVQSPRIRAQLATEFDRLPLVPVPERSESRAAEARAVQAEVAMAATILRRSSPVQATLGPTPAAVHPATPDAGVAATLGPTPATQLSAAPGATVGPTPTRARASGSGSGYGSGPEAVAEGKLSNSQDQNAAEVDARDDAAKDYLRWVDAGAPAEPELMAGRDVDIDGQRWLDRPSPHDGTIELAPPVLHLADGPHPDDPDHGGDGDGGARRMTEPVTWESIPVKDEPTALASSAIGPPEHDVKFGLVPPPAEPPRAMPPDHCGNHRERMDHCGRCTTAAEDQRRWIADRDAKVATAREAAQAELAVEAAMPEPPLEPAAPGSGRAQFRAEAAKLRARREARELEEVAPKPTGPPPATGVQLTAIATALGDRNIVSRPARLDAIAAIVGHPVGSSKDLTADEAHQVLNRLVGPPPVDEPLVGPDDDRDEPGADERAAVAESTDLNVNANALADDGPPCGRCGHEHDDECAASVIGVEATSDGSGYEVEMPCGCPEWVPPEEDGSEPPPSGDDAAEAEYVRDQASWRDGDDDEVPTGARFAMTTTGSDDEPPFG